MNATGIYLSWKSAAKWMVKNGCGGNLLATTSASAFVAYPGFPMYTASKAAANLALFLASDESAYISGQPIRSVDGGTFARTSIIFPADLGQSDDVTSSAIPDELRTQIDR